MTGEGVISSVRQAVRSVDRDLPVFNVRTQSAQIDATIARERLFVVLTLAFGTLALVLASIGIYGTVAHSVARRTSEIGIRLALGADRRQVRLMILREASSPAVLGAAIGLAVAALLTQLRADDAVRCAAARSRHIDGRGHPHARCCHPRWLASRASRFAPRSDGRPPTRVVSVSIQYVSTRRNAVHSPPLA